MPIEDVLTDWLMWLLGGLGSALTLLGGPLLATHNRSKDNADRLDDIEPLAEEANELARANRRILAGEDDDPNHDGILEIVSDNNEQIRNLEERMQQQHEKVLERLEDATDDE
jgi:gas vesicle protein